MFVYKIFKINFIYRLIVNI